MRRRPRVLLVDDDEVALEMLRLSLSREPFDTTFCAVGVDALCLIFGAMKEGWCFEALVLDCAMPHFDAFSIAQIVRLAEKTGVVPGCRAKIAVFTAHPQTVERSTLMEESQIDKYWRKPDHVVELGTLIGEWLGVELHASLAPEDAERQASDKPDGGTHDPKP